MSLFRQMRSFVIPVFGILLATALSAQPDPLGDTLDGRPGPDLRSLKATPTGAALRVELEFHARLPDRIFGFVDLDTDGDPLSGVQGAAALAWPQLDPIGSDLTVALETWTPESGAVELRREDTGEVERILPVDAGARSVSFSVPQSLLGHGPVHLAAVVGDENAPSDVVPNRGLSSSQREPAEDDVVLGDGRFAVRVQWTDQQGNSGIGRAVLTSPDSVLFWFFEPDNWEMLVKVLDGCSLTGHFWVFTAASTTVGYSLLVTDLETGLARSYENPIGRAALPVTDTAALASCN